VTLIMKWMGLKVRKMFISLDILHNKFSEDCYKFIEL